MEDKFCTFCTSECLYFDSLFSPNINYGLYKMLFIFFVVLPRKTNGTLYKLCRKGVRHCDVTY